MVRRGYDDAAQHVADSGYDPFEVADLDNAWTPRVARRDPVLIAGILSGWLNG
jgi:hypothetical protein